MSPNTVRGLASIIVPCWNQLEFTRHCIAALMRFTRQPWELIVINNGSTDGTTHYLGGVQDPAAVPVTVIANESNQGFPAAINQGLQLARGEYLVLLNNDVVVTDGWLDQLIGLTAVRVTTEAGKGTRSTTENSEITEERTEREGGMIDRRAEGAGGEGMYAGRNVTVIDFNEGGAEGGALAVPKCGGSPPLAPPSQGGEIPATIGLAGPMSNYAAPPQLVEGVPYHDLDEMHAFAGRWRDEHRGQWFTVPKLSGFCLLMTRAVYEKVGGLDERFGLGFFDDDDLAERARRAGFELAVAHDLFVHHFGSRTFAGNGVDAGRVLDENARRFADKWGLQQTNGRRVALKPFTGKPQNRRDEESRSRPAAENKPEILNSKSEMQIRAPARSPRFHRHPSAPSADKDPPLRMTPKASANGKAKVSLSIIARDEETNLPKCLESVQGLFDEIVVVDTGSKDRTVEIARSFGAKVFDFVWVDDFAAARNAALARATGDYAFWLDADDVIDPPEREKLRALLGQLRDGGAEHAFVVRCACDPSPDGTGGETVVDHIRLFPLRDDVRWTYRVHEQILPALRRADVPVQWTDITVRHTGYVDLALRARKLDRDTKILMTELAERPEDPFVRFNLGSIALERKDWNQALDHLKRSLAGSAPTDSITRKLFALIARVHQMRGDTQAALRTCAEGLSFEPDDAELWFRKAVVHRHRGEPAEAERCWRRILTLHRPQKFASVDQGIYGHLTRRNLAALAAERGDHHEAGKLWTEILAECPGDREALAKLDPIRA